MPILNDSHIILRDEHNDGSSNKPFLASMKQGDKLAVDQGYLDFVTEKLDGLEDLTVKKMFGGAGLFSGGKMFALIHGGILYFKVDESNEKEYSDKGSNPFIPPFGKRRMKMPYYEVPGDILDDMDKIVEWAEKSVEIALGGK